MPRRSCCSCVDVSGPKAKKKSLSDYAADLKDVFQIEIVSSDDNSQVSASTISKSSIPQEEKGKLWFENESFRIVPSFLQPVKIPSRSRMMKL